MGLSELHTFFTSPLGVVLTALAGFIGLTGINAVSGGELVWRVWGRLLARRHRRPLSLPDVGNRRKVVGREADVAALRGILHSGRAGAIVPVATVTGGGGVGKTTLARHYIASYRAEYDRIEFIRSATRSGAMTELAVLADRLEAAQPAVRLEDRALRALDLIHDRCAKERWLIVYDNVEKPDSMDGLWAQGRKLHLLVTTRWPDWRAEGFVAHQAGVLTPVAAVALLEQEAGRGDPEMGRLAKELGYLPLALVQAGDWLASHPRKTVADYLAGLDKYLDDWPVRTGETHEYDRTTVAVVRVTLGTVSRDARAMLGILVHFDSDGIAPQIFDLMGKLPWLARLRRDLWDLPWRVWAICRNPARLDAVWAELRQKALIEDRKEGARFIMHRLNQRNLRLILGRKANLDSAATVLLCVYPGYRPEPIASADLPYYRSNQLLYDLLMPHLLAIHATGIGRRTTEITEILKQQSDYLRMMAEDPGVAKVSANMLAHAEASLPAEDREIAVAMANHGISLLRLGNLDEAQTLLERTVALHTTHRPGSADLADSYDLLGGVLFAQGRAGLAVALPQAAKQYQKALALRRRLFGRGYAVAEALNNLGTVRDAQGRGAAAARLYGAGLKIWRAVLPPRDARLGYGLVNTGSGWLQAGRADLAEPLLREALELWQAVFAGQPQHPNTRKAADWLILCLLRRAAAGENRGLREMEARQLCERYGIDLETQRRLGMQYPYAPGA